MLRSLKIFWVLLLALGLLGFMGGSSLVMAGGADVAHVTHRTHDRGPHLGDDCARCHTDPNDPRWHNVDWNACDICHSPGGAYDGVNDPELGAKNNWANLGSAAISDVSLIYESDGSLKADKEKWCATCHDQSETGALGIDDFESYYDPHIPPDEYNANLQQKWKAGKDARKPTLQEPGVRGADMIEGWAMRVGIVWDRNLNQNYGVVQRDFNPPLDLSGKNFFNFYLKVQKVNRIKNVRVKLRKASTGTYCTAKIDVDSVNGFTNDVWKLVSLPRESFDDQTCFDEPNDVDQVRFHIFEKSPFTEPTWETYVYFDDIGCDVTGPYVGGDIVGDDVVSGYYITGHRMPCKWCHDPGSAHIDGNRRPVLEYIKYTDNPTKFRFYDDPTKQMQLPYNNEIGYVAGPEGSFALCYGCHDEEGITTSAISYDCLGNPDLKTNFREDDYCVAGAWEHNLHYYHVVNEQTVGSLFNATCVLCHEPHGDFNPAMTRQEMGDSIYFDMDGCEIVDRDIDRNSNDAPDWRDPDANMGLAQTTVDYEPLCRACHDRPDYDLHLPDPDCEDGQHNAYADGDNVFGYYKRTYAYIPHGGGPCGECHEGHGLETGSHATHTKAEDSPKGPDPVECSHCHGEGADGTECNLCHGSGGGPGPGWVGDIATMVANGSCDECHSPEGAYDGVNDPDIGAKANWADGAYDYDADPAGTTLRAGKEQWCAGCHDDDPTTTDTNESAFIDGVYAPGIAGVDYTPDANWYSPVSVIPPGAGYLIDGNPATGNTGAPFQYAECDLGGSYLVTDIQLYVGSYPAGLWWQVLAWNGTEWIPVLGAGQVLYGWKTGHLGAGAYQAKVDMAVRATKLRLVKLGPPLTIPNMLFEFQYKKDNLSYGYFFNTGHAIACSNCHDFTKDHIDGEPRTYEAALDNYEAGYRLDFDVDVANLVPRPAGGVDIKDFGLCLKSGCHPEAAFKSGGGPITLTNFRDDGEGINDHVRHLEDKEPGLYFDSDFDGVADSDMTCTACHNVHGSPTPAMIRHGELSDHVPALNFRYLDSNGDPDGYLMDAYPDSSGGATYYYGAGDGTIARNGICDMCHNDSIPYMRAPEDLTMPTP